MLIDKVGSNAAAVKTLWRLYIGFCTEFNKPFPSTPIHPCQIALALLHCSGGD